MRSSCCGSECWQRDVNHVRLIWIRGGLIWAPTPGFAGLSLCIREETFPGGGI